MLHTDIAHGLQQCYVTYWHSQWSILIAAMPSIMLVWPNEHNNVVQSTWCNKLWPKHRGWQLCCYTYKTMFHLKWMQTVWENCASFNIMNCQLVKHWSLHGPVLCIYILLYIYIYISKAKAQYWCQIESPVWQGRREKKKKRKKNNCVSVSGCQVDRIGLQTLTKLNCKICMQ